MTEAGAIGETEAFVTILKKAPVSSAPGSQDTTLDVCGFFVRAPSRFAVET